MAKSEIYKKNDILTVTVEDMGHDGEGIGKVDGFTLFVKDAVIGDTVSVKIMKSKKNYAYAHLEKVLAPSPFRVEPVCPYHRQCGGCQLQTLSYAKQLEFKENKIRSNLIRLGGFDADLIDRVMEPILGMDKPYRYRNKAQYPIGKDKNGRVVAGFYARHSHTIIPNTNCYLGVESNQEILEVILAFLEKHHIEPYDEITGKGLVRHVLIRSGFTSGQIMVCLVINSGVKENGCYFPHQEELLSKLQRIEGMTGISVSLNRENTNVIMGKELETLWGSPVIWDRIHIQEEITDESGRRFVPTGEALDFHISPLSFYQVNPLQMERLYSLALEYAGLNGTQTVWDLYCGIGTISLFLATRAKQVYGVEVVPEAIQDARENAERNRIGNAEFFVGKAEEVLPDFYENAQQASAMRHPDVIVVDPPRKGCDSACLETILKMKPERVVYVSCDSATLARDLRVLCDGGYEVKRVRGVDQFCQGVHVETVCLLSNRKPDTKVRIDVDLEDYYRIKDAKKNQN